MLSIEEQRLANLANKEKLLADLNLHSKKIQPISTQTTKRENGTSTKKRKIELLQASTRSSARLQSTGSRPSYKEESDRVALAPRARATPKSRTTKTSSRDELALEVKVGPAPDVDAIRKGWSSWEATGPLPTRDEVGAFHFEDYATFLPNKSPEEMIREGCFGGSYWRPLKSRRLGVIIEGDWKELPEEWIEGLDVEKFLTSPSYDPDVNKYKVTCGQSIEEWEASGWIMHEYDVRGWFQWYCRFYQGRRCPDDDRQVSRWRKCVGETGRWKRMLLKAYLKMGVQDVFDDGEDEETREVSPVMHQTCHHWAYEIKQHDLDEIYGKPG